MQEVEILLLENNLIKLFKKEKDSNNKRSSKNRKK